jgi:hypothetical protein
MNVIKLRDLFESRSKETNGRWRFLTEMRQGLGLCDKDGNENRDFAGNLVLKDRALRPENFSLQELAEAIIGPSWRQLFSPDSRAMGQYTAARSMMEANGYAGDKRALVEATGFGLDPSAFLNINTFTSIVGGLVEVKILEAFQNPALIADRLMPVESTKLNGQKVIGVQNIGDRAKKRAPGETHTRAQFGERWITTPETRENALAIDVLKETVFFDLTGQVLQMASSVGEELAYRKELEVIDAVLGVTNPFVYNNTGYNTYVTSRTLGYLNAHTNQLVDWTSIQSASLLFSRMEDPHTGKRLLITPNTVLVNPARLATAQLILGASGTELRTAPGATQSSAVSLNVASSTGNPYSGQFTILSSPLIEQRCLASDGLNLNQANTDGLWFMMEAGKSFKYMQNFPLTVTQAAPNQYEMLDRGIVATYFANERGIPSVWSPWHTVKNNNA